MGFFKQARQAKYEKECAEKIKHEQEIKKIREEYMELLPVTVNDILGMRKSFYEMINIGDRRGKVIEFFLTDGTRCFLGDSDFSSRTEAQYYIAPDSIDDVCEALSYVIPRFADGKMQWYNTGYGDLYGLEADRWHDIIFEKEYLKAFIDSNSVNTLSASLYKKIERITSSWNKSGMVQILGREVYDGWKDRINQVSVVVSNNLKAEAEKSAKEKEKIEEEKRRKIEEERQRKEEEYRREREKRILEERIQKEEEENRREQEKQAKIIEAGKRGEEQVDYALKWLDKSYRILKNADGRIRIKNTDFIDEPQEYDHIVVGPVGIILIETKAYSGEIVIDEAGNWRRNKNGEWIGEVNPIQQIRRHEKLLRSFVPADIPIISYICLANSSVIINGIENSVIPIVKSDLLIERIEKLDVKNTLNEQQIDECISLIKEHMI